ncbi:complex I NDUFA9 subunit family protein [Parvularcula sp. IMCC14364]|uniref:complex I NDUFA9 subunit family protein n=1 Tax=Parvularcula sp. IMCC14364 TaxID=3067902 RepID=UPI0027403A1A|nr:complex I NDUFA9 subunit family protein [Parvularcula sp. IMCC14364]
MTGKLAVVFGGSGFVGRNVVRELASRGWRVRAAVRRPHLAQFLRPMGAVGQVQLFQANVRHAGSVAEALQGADAVINLVGILAEEGDQSFSAVQADGARAIASLAASEGVAQAVHVSAIGALADSESVYARTKAEGEAATRAHMPQATILRPSIVFGPRDDFFNRFADMARLSPALPLIGGGKTRFQPVYVDDVADSVCAAFENPSASGKTYELGGPGVYSFRELMEYMLKVIGRRRLLVPLPFPVAAAMGTIGQNLGKLPFVSAPLTADQVELLKSDNIVGISGEDTIGTIEDLGITPQTLESILPGYLVRFRKYGQFSPETV